MPRVFWMKMSCKKVFSMTYFIQINFIKNDLNKNVLVDCKIKLDT